MIAKKYWTWEKAFLFVVDIKRKNGKLNYTIEEIDRNINTISGSIYERIYDFSVNDLKEEYQLKIKEYIDNGHIVLMKKEYN